MTRLFVVRRVIRPLLSFAMPILMVACVRLDVDHSEVIDLAGKAFEGFSANFPSDRDSLGFPTIPTKGEAKVLYLSESGAKQYGCNVLLKMPVSTNGFLREWLFAFEKQAGSLKFLGEDVQYQGPEFFGSEEKFREVINVTRRLRPVLSSTEVGLRITYSGPTKALTSRALTPDEIKPIVKEWAKVMPYP